MQLVPNPLIIPVGMFIGVLIAVPLGPVNVLCVQRALERGFWGGMAAGLGAVLGDGVIALLAALGVGAVSGAVAYHRTTIQLVGGFALLVFGARLYFTRPNIVAPTSAQEEAASLKDFAWDIPQTFLLTVTNPAAVLGLFAIFSGVSSFVNVDSWVDALTMVAAIVGGSLIWWIVLSRAVGLIRHRITVERLQLVNRVAGVLLVGFGFLLIGEIVLKWLRVL